jgi:Na+-translocating ferredoxin:NAD+ oxidoreductase RnfC subunit
MEYIACGKRGDIERMAEISFDCIQCGLCAIRCPAELAQYNFAQLARRLYGKHHLHLPEHLKNRLSELQKKKYELELKKLMTMPAEELRKVYTSRDIEKE